MTRVLFIRETDQQMTGSNCCGKLEGENACQKGESLFPESRSIMELTGVLYRAVRERFRNDVDVQIIDPRNHLYLVPRLVRDAFRYRVPPAEALKTIFTFSLPSIIINGRLAYSGKLPAPDTLIKRLESIKG